MSLLPIPLECLKEILPWAKKQELAVTADEWFRILLLRRTDSPALFSGLDSKLPEVLGVQPLYEELPWKHGYEPALLESRDLVYDHKVGAFVNKVAVYYSEATADWGRVDGLAIFDSSGRVIGGAALQFSKVIRKYDNVKFAVNGITIFLDS